MIVSPIPNWTASKWKGWIISLLRKGTIRYPPRNECLRNAFVDRRVNPNTGRMAKHYRCASCLEVFPLKQVCVDHIESVIPTTGFTTWDDYIQRMFCSVEGLQILCVECHAMKSSEENRQRKSNGK